MTPPPRRGRRPQQQEPLANGGRRRRRHREQLRSRRRRRALLLALGVILPVVALVAAGIGGTAAFSASCDLSSLQPVSIGENSFVYAADGSLLGAIPAERNRTPVPRSEISPWMAKATVAIEDRRFYEHGGVDYEGILRALAADIRAGKVVQGGSTITQQLVRNLYIGNARKSIHRKIVEACLAIKLSRHWSKNKILTAYMNQVFYGNHAFGVEAAAETYFSKTAKELTLDEAATLAGLPQAPSVYDPFHRSADALRRRNAVLKAMLDNGDITSSQYAQAKTDRSLHLQPGRRYTRIREPYFFTYVEDVLQQAYGTNTVRSGGLKVYTTIIPRLQSAARRAISDVLTESSDPSSAIVAINPRTGAIEAMTAVTPGRKGNQFNLVSQARRQPGSTFKAIALTTAVSMGINPNTTYYLSAPFTYNPDPSGSCYSNPPTAWCVQTYDHTYLGSTSLENATVHSDNSVFARLSVDIGPENIAKMAYRLGVRVTPMDAVPAIALGAIAVTPLEMASVYATLAAGGVYSEPMAIRKVVLASGKVDGDAGWGRPKQERVISDGVAYTVTQVLEQNMLHGTGVGAYFGRTSAGKTGTTDNYADAWFCGYVPQLEATVWVGYPRAEIPMLNVHGITVSGPTFPATIWKDFMEAAVGKARALDFPTPLTEPDWVAWHGQYQYSGPAGYGTTTGTTGSTATATTEAATTAPTTATTETVPATTTTEPAPTLPPETTLTTTAVPPSPPPTTVEVPPATETQTLPVAATP